MTLDLPGRLRGIDLDQAPLLVAPDLAIEIVSKNDRADDLLLKVSQFLAAGAKAVWLLYSNTRLPYRYLPGKLDGWRRHALLQHVCAINRITEVKHA